MNRKWLLPLGWASIIFGSSCTVIFRSSFLDGVRRTVPSVASRRELDHFWDRYWWVFVKGYHAMEYAILFWLLLWALPSPKSLRQITLALLLCVGYAVTDEYHQTFVPNRGGRWTDVVIDAGGAALAATVVLLRARSRVQSNQTIRQNQTFSIS